MSKSKKKKYLARRLARLKRFVEKEPTINVWCIDGLCKGEVFQAAASMKVLRIIVPANPAYKIAVYTITDKITARGEYAAIFMYGVSR